MAELRLSPAYKQTAKDFLGQFKYSNIVSHDWLVQRFGLPVQDERLSAAEFQARQFAWLASIEDFKTTLLQEHKVLLQSVRDQGYRWVPAAQQTQLLD